MKVFVLTPYPENFQKSCAVSPSVSAGVRYFLQGETRRVVVPFVATREAEQVDLIAQVLREEKDYIFVVDECQRIQVGRGDLPYWFKRLLDEGRHRNAWVWAIARRPVTTPLLIRSLSEEIFCFRLHSKRDIDVMGDYFGDRAENLRTLEKFHYFYYSDVNGYIAHYDANGECVELLD